MNKTYLALGSNLRTPTRQLHLALKQLRSMPRTYRIEVATFYYNPAVGRKSQPPFCNTVISIKTTLSPQALLRECQKIEKKQGRARKVRWGARTLDIDILLDKTRKINTPTLKIPHPLMLERDFVMVPLSELLGSI